MSTNNDTTELNSLHALRTEIMMARRRRLKNLEIRLGDLKHPDDETVIIQKRGIPTKKIDTRTAERLLGIEAVLNLTIRLLLDVLDRMGR